MSHHASTGHDHGGAVVSLRASWKLHMIPLESLLANCFKSAVMGKHMGLQVALQLNCIYVNTVCKHSPSKPGNDWKACHSCINGLDVRKKQNLLLRAHVKSPKPKQNHSVCMQLLFGLKMKLKPHPCVYASLLSCC